MNIDQFSLIALYTIVVKIDYPSISGAKFKVENL